MNAIWKTRKGQVEIRSLPEPLMQDTDDVKIRVRYSLIGDVDLRMYREGDFCAKDGIAGYEMMGEIVSLGSRAQEDGFQVGDRVSSLPVLFCGRCKFCKTGRENCCVDIINTQGTLCEYVVRKSRQLVKVPDHISDQSGCFMFRVSEMLEAVEKLDPQLFDLALILGGGASAVIALQLLKRKGVEKIFVIEPLPERRQLALKMGADDCWDSIPVNFRTQALEASDFMGFDLILETSGNSELFHMGAGLVSRGGKVCLPLYYDIDQNLSFNSVSIYYAHATLITSFLCNKKMEAAMDLIPRLKLEELVTKEFSFLQSPKAFAELKKGDCYAIGITMK